MPTDPITLLNLFDGPVIILALIVIFGLYKQNHALATAKDDMSNKVLVVLTEVASSNMAVAESMRGLTNAIQQSKSNV